MEKQTVPARSLVLIPRLTDERREEVYACVAEISSPSRSFYLMVAISTAIAAFGLLANSTAVVIGAMLVAPLMGPIFGIALALTVGDERLLRSAVLAEIAGMLLSIVLGVAIGLMPLRLGFGSEIIARTQPTLYDVVIALASGVAGAYALLDEKISPALPGVAIATAIVPPLASCGLALSAGEWGWAWGAFLLFAANFLSIEVAAAFVFAVSGMAQVAASPAALLAQIAGRFRVSLAALVAVSIFMTQTLMSLIGEQQRGSAIEKILSQELRETVGASLSRYDVAERRAVVEVVATILTPQEFEPEQVGRMEASLRQQVDPRIHLIVRSLISKDADRHGPVFFPTREQERHEERERQTRSLSLLTRILTEQVQKIPGARLVDVRRETGEGELRVTATVRAPTLIEPRQVAAMEAALERELDSPARLLVRTVLVHEADARGYLYRGRAWDRGAPERGEAP